ncbi:hypothetical protein H9P43_005783 [Blastocladiella emersonii ATCC 22665]|nr:hypothetical protein H9P43_005783 [Blastocladiella emersonii ATCC 22665]
MKRYQASSAEAHCEHLLHLSDSQRVGFILFAFDHVRTQRLTQSPPEHAVAAATISQEELLAAYDVCAKQQLAA